MIGWLPMSWVSTLPILWLPAKICQCQGQSDTMKNQTQTNTKSISSPPGGSHFPSQPGQVRWRRFPCLESDSRSHTSKYTKSLYPSSMFDHHTPIAVILVPNVLTTCLGLKQHTNQYHPSFQAHTKDSPSWGCCLLFTFSMLILSRSDLLHHELAVIVVELLAPEQLFKRAHDTRRPGQDFRFG